MHRENFSSFCWLSPGTEKDIFQNISDAVLLQDTGRIEKQAVQLYVKLEQNLQEMKLEMARVEYPSYKKDGGVWRKKFRWKNVQKKNELIKQWKVIAGQDIPDRERISVILKRDH